MRKLKFKYVFCIICGLLLLFVLREWLKPERYKVGMTWAEVEPLMPEPYKKHRYGIDYEKEPTQRQLMEDAVYHVHEEREGVVLVFNHYDKIISTERVKYLGVDLVKLKMLFN
ncbi:MAG TPA: hypothetical protein VGH19_11430 [Verrucomicrobiae bacterium]